MEFFPLQIFVSLQWQLRFDKSSNFNQNRFYVSLVASKIYQSKMRADNDERERYRASDKNSEQTKKVRSKIDSK